MRKFNVNVNGKTYAVEVEEIGAPVYEAPAAPAAPAPAPVAAPKAAPAPAAPAASAAPKAAGAGDPVKTQMPGLVKKLCFSNGATVKKNDTIVILEAMKMDTPIVAPKDGVITYSVSEGANIDTGTVLCTIA
ncbi:MAG TPA: acetyl-CoA carboxylase biotin carboxyl carrier protein subunit [Candidatus Ornithoclostridium faecigallinarum]|nr:acetyl-CoA carboxylase biotin carboxyl carrier protein subunit [Candidatus Ornithoclostridium faecigallinarum]